MINRLHLRISSVTWLRKVTAVIKSDDASSIMSTGPLLMTYVYKWLETQRVKGHFPVTIFSHFQFVNLKILS